jgi:hypothetical protein
MISLYDVMGCRLSELSQIIAGCSAVDPVQVIPLLKHLEISDLRDDLARAYIATLVSRFDEIQAAKGEQVFEIVVQAAFKCNCPIEFMKWLNRLNGWPAETAEKAIKDIKSIIVARAVISDLQDYVKETQLISRWGK